jgi:hypothetical protein
MKEKVFALPSIDYIQNLYCLAVDATQKNRHPKVPVDGKALSKKRLG